MRGYPTIGPLTAQGSDSSSVRRASAVTPRGGPGFRQTGCDTGRVSANGSCETSRHRTGVGGPRRTAPGPSPWAGSDQLNRAGTQSSRRWISVTSSGPNWFEIDFTIVPNGVLELVL